jgi:hypothetical protein
MAANKIVELSMVSDFNDDFASSHFENDGLVKMTMNAIFIITNQFLTSK